MTSHQVVRVIVVHGACLDMNFEFATAARIVFGQGTIRDAGSHAERMGTRALVVTGSNPGRATRLIDILRDHGVESSTAAVYGEPTVRTIVDGIDLLRDADCDFVIGFGGGSAIDAAKAIAILTTNPGDPVSYLEVIGKGKPITEPPLPVIAIPTTAGTGSEVTSNAVLAAPDRRVKVSLRSPLVLPRLALIDPELTYSLPPEITAWTGMDALTQLIEPLVSRQANPLTDALCREGIRRAARSIRRAAEHGDHAPAREDMALASLMGGLALANARLGAVHGFASAIGGMFEAPHGAICAALLPQVMRANINALRQREPKNPALARYLEVARIVLGRGDVSAEDGAAWAAELTKGFTIPRLGSFGVKSTDVTDILDRAARSGSMKGNPIALTADELAQVLEQAL